MSDGRLICIEGKHLMQKQTGVQRYTQEILAALDTIIDSYDFSFELVVPTNVGTLPSYKNIKLVKYGRCLLNVRLWLQTGFARYVRKNKAIALCLGNEMPLYYRNSIVQLHDINAITYAQKKQSLLKYYYYYYYYVHIKKYAGHILTQTKKTRYDIHSHFDVKPDRLSIIYCSYEHVHKIKPSTTALQKYGLTEKDYYFSIFSPYQPTKNFYWICRVAKNNPNTKFVICGRKNRKKTERKLEYTIPENVQLIGYAPDEEAVELMAKCKAFVFPSLAEGFGMPPMEALALGAPIIISDVPPFPEIYNDSAHYIDPLEYDYYIDELTNKTAAPPTDCLNKYSWEKSAAQLIGAIKQYTSQY